MYQVGSGGGAVFAHQPGAVNLHRAVADQQRFADFFRGHALQQARRRLLHMGLPIADSAAITPRQLLDLLAQHQARANTAADAWGAWQQWLQALEAVRYAPAGSTQHAATTPTAQLRQLKTRLPRLPQLPLAQAQPAQTQPSTG